LLFKRLKFCYPKLGLRYAPRDNKALFEMVDYSINSDSCASANLSLISNYISQRRRLEIWNCGLICNYIQLKITKSSLN